MKVVLKDGFDSVKNSATPIEIKSYSSDSLLINPEGYGDHDSVDGCGTPVLLERYKGRLRLIVWADINQEGPTHMISLEGAREDNRLSDETEYSSDKTEYFGLDGADVNCQ